MATIRDIMAAAELTTENTIDNYAIIGRIEATEAEARELLALANDHAHGDDLNRRRYWAMLERLAGVQSFASVERQAPVGTIGTPAQFEADIDAEYDERDHSEAVLAALRAWFGDDAEELWGGYIALLDIAGRSARWASVASELVLLRREMVGV